MLARQTSNGFLCKLMHICIRMMTTGYHISRRLLQINYVCTAQKSFKVHFTHEMIRAFASKDTMLLYLFIELLAIFRVSVSVSLGTQTHREKKEPTDIMILLFIRLIVCTHIVFDLNSRQVPSRSVDKSI